CEGPPATGATTQWPRAGSLVTDRDEGCAHMRLRKHQSRLRLAAITSGAALVITSFTATGAGAAPDDPDDLSLTEAQPTATSREDGPKAPTSALVETPKKLPSDRKSGVEGKGAER